ncbi:MAG: hypothetical protein EHM35_01060 [Planctomycetaceae bacterium]|nr:MAG: hypothetical protein EHM35_01060 [Planctomycetaceae bacterium]
MSAYPTNGSNPDTWDAALKTWLDQFLAGPGLGEVTLGVGAATIAVANRMVTVTGDAGGTTVTTITGGIAGQDLILIFVDDKVTITDDATKAANTVNLSAAFTSAANATLHLGFDGTSWYEIARSTN